MGNRDEAAEGHPREILGSGRGYLAGVVGKLTALILEDEPDHVALIRAALEAGGVAHDAHVVATLHDFEKALASSPDIILADYRLDGFTAVDALRVREECGDSTPVVIVTSMGEEAAFECLRAGADDYVLKDRIGRLPVAVRQAVELAVVRRRVRLAEDARRRIEDRYHVLFEEDLAGHYVTTPSGEFISCNTTFARLLGYPTVHAALDDNATNLYRDPAGRADWVGRICAERRVPAYEVTLSRADGVLIHVLDGAAGLFSPDGELLEIHGFLIDITDRKQAEAERDQLAIAMEQAAEAVTITDRDGVIQWVNPAFSQMTGYTRDEAVGRTPRLHRSGQHDQAFFEELWKTVLSGGEWTGTITNRHKLGAVYKVDTTISPVRDTHGNITGFLAFQKDITVEAALQEQVRQLQKMEALGHLVGGVAHDFNNTLNVISLNAELLLEALPTDDADRRDLVREVLNRAERGRDLISKLMIFSRRDPIALETRDLWEVVNDLEATLRRLLPATLDVKMLVEPPGPTVELDASAVEHMVLNLATNARDAMPQGGTLRIEGRVVSFDHADLELYSWAAAGDFACVAVTDTGAGIHPDAMEHLFEPFYTTKEAGAGTGLGTSVTYGLMKSHGGFVQAYSEVGVGTAMKLYFPLAAGATRDGDDLRPSALECYTGTETVLLVEDDAALRRGGTRALRRLGYEVLAAPNGRAGLELFRKRHHDVALLLSDVVMPEMGGKELVRAVREVKDGIPAVLMSGNAIEERVAKELDIRFLPKPWTLEDLARAVREAIDGAAGKKPESRKA